jgi:hypothetical protein
VLDVVDLKHLRTLCCGSLHLVEHVRERRLEPQSFLDLVRRDIRIFSVLKEARTLVFPHECYERCRVLLPVLRKIFEVGEDGRNTGLAEQRYRILGVLVEVGIEDALILKM